MDLGIKDVALIFLIAASSISLIDSRHAYRVLYEESQRQIQYQQKLQGDITDYKKLLSKLRDKARIESIAENDLKENQKRLLDVDNPLVVPEGTRIKFLITGNDVMHSFFVPSLALQVYSIAGRVNEIWTEVPMGKKKYYGQCNQICGVNHAYMPIVIQALPKDEYKEWLKEAKVKFANVQQTNFNKIALLDKKEIKEIK